MEGYNLQLGEHANSRSSRSNCSFLYGPGGPILGAGSSVFGRTSGAGGDFHLHQTSGGGDCYDHPPGPIVKSEGGSTSQNNNHGGPNPKFNYHNHDQGPPAIRGHFPSHERENESSDEFDAIKAKIIAHPHYSNLLEAYMDCQKVGAPPEVVARLAEVRQEFEARQRAAVSGDSSKDPELDRFMEAYYDMLVKYREELTRPLQEAMEFMRRIETQLNILTNGSVRILNSEDKCEGEGSSEEDQDNMSGGEIDPRADDRELKNHLLKKYSGYLSSLKQELSKKKKKGKLPKDARQKLLNWWELHYKWPYPSESEKVALAESTGLDQKQINNWFINQRKRHWKPSEDMQFMVMEGLHPQTAALYMEGHYMGDGPYRLGP